MAKSQPAKYLKYVYWDTSVFLEGFDGTSARQELVAYMLEECTLGRLVIYTSTLSIAEVQYAKSEKAQKALSKSTERAIAKLWHPGSKIRLVEVHELICREAAMLSRSALGWGWDTKHPEGFSIKAPDAIHLATAIRVSKLNNSKISEFNAYDDGYTKYAPHVSFRICEPEPAQRPLQMLAGDDEHSMNESGVVSESVKQEK